MTEKWLVHCEDQGLAARIRHVFGRDARVRHGARGHFETEYSVFGPSDVIRPPLPAPRQSIILVVGFREHWLKHTLTKYCQTKNLETRLIVATFGGQLSTVSDSNVNVHLTVVLPSVGAVLGQITSEKRTYWAQCPVSRGAVLIDDVISKIIAYRHKSGSLDLTGSQQCALSESSPFGEEIRQSREDVLAKMAIQAMCGVDLIYRCGPSERYKDRTVANIRFEMGKTLAKQLPVWIRNQIDIVVPIPQTGRYYAQGLANELKKPYVEIISKANNSGRSFDIANSATRRNFLVSNLEKVATVEAGTTVALVDEAIFTGATLKAVTELFDDVDVSILILIATPPSVTRCAVGMMPERALLTEYIDIDDMSSYFNVDRVCFLDPETFQREFAGPNDVCTRCFEEGNTFYESDRNNSSSGL